MELDAGPRRGRNKGCGDRTWNRDAIGGEEE